MPDKGRSMMWFRKGLRLHDNPALLEALEGAEHLYPVFCLDPGIIAKKEAGVGVNRMQFLLESLSDLHSSLKGRGSRLIVLHGKPAELFPKVWKDWGITKLCFEVDTEPYAQQRDKHISELAKKQGLQVETRISHTLFDPYEVDKISGSKPITSYKALQSAAQKLGPPPQPAEDPPDKLPGVPGNAKGAEESSTGVPSLQDLGYTQQPSTPFHGGESRALARLQDQLKDKAWVAQFEKPKGNPAALEPCTTVLSPYMKFGCISSRLFYAKLAQIEKEHKNHTQPPTSLVGQLLWREMFYASAVGCPNFDKMEANPICKQIDWDESHELYKAWDEGRTGYPWIDAIMKQLHEHGWLHHLARHATACFLTRGDLYVPWEWGRDTFDRLLIDADWSVNTGNWMWLSASAYFSQFFRVYSPISFGRKYDKEGAYIRHFLPVLKDMPDKYIFEPSKAPEAVQKEAIRILWVAMLKTPRWVQDMPDKYIFEPWKAPEAVQKKANCIIGKDYPAPIVDHATKHKDNLNRIKACYDAAKDKGAETPTKKHVDEEPRERGMDPDTDEEEQDAPGGEDDTVDDADAVDDKAKASPSEASNGKKTPRKGSKAASPKQPASTGKKRGRPQKAAASPAQKGKS